MRKLWIFGLILFCYTNGSAQEARQELRPWREGQWAVVSVREKAGVLLVLHPALGREIDFEEYNRYALFQGVTEFNKKWRVPALSHPVPGFQSARCVKLQNGDYGIDVAYRDELSIRHKWIKMWDRAELDRSLDYLRHAIDDSENLKGFPQETQEAIVFEVVVPKYAPTHRFKAELSTTEGKSLRGSLLPILEDRQVLVDTAEGFRRVDMATIQQIHIGGSGGKNLVRQTVRGGIQWSLIGGLTGLIAGAAYENTSGKNEMLYGALVMGTVGASFGFVDGLFSIRPARTFHLDTPKGESRRELELNPFRIRLRF